MTNIFHKVSKLAVLSCVLAVGLSACESSHKQTSEDAKMEAQENAVNITGSVSYRERIMPPPGSTVTVTLNDVSIADRAAPVLAKQTIDLDGQSVPVDFSLSVPSADIKPNMRYSVRATLNGPDGELLWTTDMANMIDTSGEASDLGMLVMKRTERK